jgi:hypothetical protein
MSRHDWGKAGFTVAGTVGSGAQALRIAAAVMPDVVLLNLNLPDLPGLDRVGWQDPAAVEANISGAMPRPVISPARSGKLLRDSGAPVSAGRPGPCPRADTGELSRRERRRARRACPKTRREKATDTPYRQ